MSEVAEKLNEAIEKAHESKLNTLIAMCVAVIATFRALCNVKASNIVQQMSKEQAHAVDQNLAAAESAASSSVRMSGERPSSP